MILHPASRARRLGPFGILGGDRLARSLGQRLDDEWHWFRSVSPGGIEPVDGVLVGPGGTFALTLAGERGRFARRNGHWYRWNRSTESWIPWEPAPITAARLAARRLGLYLDRAALPGSVMAILLPPESMSVEAAPGEQIGVDVERDPERIAALAVAEERLTRPQVDRIVALLDPRQPLPRLAPSAPRG
jgi:hypothetical protein